MSDASPPGSGLQRPLGLTETICAEYFRQVPCGLQVVAAVTIDRELPRDAVREAAERVRQAHPVLASVLQREAGGRWRFGPAGPDAVEVRGAPSGSAWRDRFRAALQEPLDPARALWRLEVVERPTDAPQTSALILVAHHAAVDGESALTILTELLQSARPTALPALPALEDLLPDVPASPGAAAGAVAEGAWPVLQEAPTGQRTFGFLTLEVPGDVLAAVHTRAQEEGTTVTSALMVALCAASRALPDTTDTIGFNVPADARGRVTPPLDAQTVGAYFVRSHIFADRSDAPRDPWALARDLAHAAHADVSACLRRPAAWTTDEVAALVRRQCDDRRSHFDLAFLLTNLGAVRLPDDVHGFWFTTVQSTGVEAFVVSAATLADTLHLGVAWPDPLVDRASGETLAQAFRDALRYLT